MTHPKFFSRPALLALLVALAAGCTVGDTGDPEIGSIGYMPEVDCTGLSEWALNTKYVAGDVVTDTGDAFTARVNHTSFASNWNPKQAASLWLAAGYCTGEGGGGDEQPPPAPGGDDDEEEPIPPPAEGCQANGRPGPLFDLAGVPNVGNGEGDQFIGGQCLDASDCASGCCALPCGICSGPGAQFQNGKQGCGFGD
jgi:hypothetical protein